MTGTANRLGQDGVCETDGDTARWVPHSDEGNWKLTPANNTIYDIDKNCRTLRRKSDKMCEHGQEK